jgi:hypothetical protein
MLPKCWIPLSSLGLIGDAPPILVDSKILDIPCREFESGVGSRERCAQAE